MHATQNISAFNIYLSHISLMRYMCICVFVRLQFRAQNSRIFQADVLGEAF